VLVFRQMRKGSVFSGAALVTEGARTVVIAAKVAVAPRKSRRENGVGISFVSSWLRHIGPKPDCPELIPAKQQSRCRENVDCGKSQYVSLLPTFVSGNCRDKVDLLCDQT